MKKLAIICNSTASLSESTKNNKDVYVLPLLIINEEKSYRDLEDLSIDDSYDLIKNQNILTTSQPSLGEGETLLNKLVEEYENVLYITFSGSLSGTYESALMLKNMNEQSNKIHIFDTEAASLIEEGFVLYALRHKDLEINDLISKMEPLRIDVKIFLMVEDLKHLQRGGRITKFESFLGNLAKIKPILEVTKEKIVPYEKIRTSKKAYDFLISEFDKYNVNEKDFVIVVDARCDEGIKYVKEKLENELPNVKINYGFLSPVISIHTGLGSLGVGFIKNFYE